MDAALPVITAPRQCSGCTACCDALTINDPALVKHKDRRCTHVCESGCKIWGPQTQPATCREFVCDYIHSVLPLTEADRPDQLGAIVHRWEDGGWLLTEYFQDGLLNLLSNDHWGTAIRSAFKEQELSIYTSFRNDPFEQETMRVKWLGDHVGCELACSDDLGDPVLVSIEPQYEEPVQRSVFVAGQNFAFDGRALAAYLGERPSAIVTASSGSALCFKITRRMIKFINALDAM